MSTYALKRYLIALLTVLLAFCSVFVYADSSAETNNSYEVSFTVLGVRSDEGILKAVLCTKEENFPSDCKIRKEAKANMGNVIIDFQHIAAGEYAFALFHDENTNGKIDMLNVAVPKEGLAFGNDAIGRTGTPSFVQSAMTISGSVKKIVKIRYLK